MDCLIFTFCVFCTWCTLVYLLSPNVYLAPGGLVRQRTGPSAGGWGHMWSPPLPALAWCFFHMSYMSFVIYHISYVILHLSHITHHISKYQISKCQNVYGVFWILMLRFKTKTMLKIIWRFCVATCFICCRQNWHPLTLNFQDTKSPSSSHSPPSLVYTMEP